MKGNVAFDGNMMCTGGAMIQGEMYVQHITGPLEEQLTDYAPETYGTANPEAALKIGFLKNNQTILMDIPGVGSNILCLVKQTVEIVTTDGGQTADEECVYVAPHQHVFRNIPMTLGGTYGEVRKSAFDSGMVGSAPIAASPILNGLKAPQIQYAAPESAFGSNQRTQAPKISPLKFAAPTG